MNTPTLHSLESRPAETSAAGNAPSAWTSPAPATYDAIAALATMSGKTKAEYARAVLEQHAFGAIGYARTRKPGGVTPWATCANDVVDFGDFFAPTSTDLVDGLLGQYRGMRARIETVAELIEGETAAAISYFLEGNGRSRDGVPVVDACSLDGAVAALNSAYWAKAMQLTDVLDLMPQARRDAWHASIREHKCPDFDEATVRATLEDLLGQRHTFLAERVDGIFEACRASTSPTARRDSANA